MMPVSDQPASLTREDWLKRLTQNEMPVFANTARLIAGELSREQRSASELARLILQDASMTARLLRLANSSYYNPSHCRISTVSRAIVVLGFETVRNISLTIGVIDSLVEGGNREMIIREMAYAFHAAGQARILAELRHDPSPEEVFIATLLQQLGRMAFWCFADRIDPEAAKRLRMLQDRGMPPHEAEQEALGFTLDSLTRTLNQHWQLSPLIDEALDKKSGDPRINAIRQGYEIASAASQGWRSSTMRGLMGSIAADTDMDGQRLLGICQAQANEAAEAISRLGIPRLDNLIPTADDATPLTDNTGITAMTIEEDSKPPQPDRELQLDILQEISDMLDSKPDINLLMEMILEGIHRGLGMDRTVFALLTPDRRYINAKYTLGWDRHALLQQFRYDIASPPASLIDYVIQSQQPLWLNTDNRNRLEKFITPPIEILIGQDECFMMPISLQGKAIGLFYCDRKPSHRPLNEELFGGFKLFANQARLGLSMM